jgi:hypothetical protein
VNGKRSSLLSPICVVTITPLLYNNNTFMTVLQNVQMAGQSTPEVITGPEQTDQRNKQFHRRLTAM